jgi:hypothetical protein
MANVLERLVAIAVGSILTISTAAAQAFDPTPKVGNDSTQYQAKLQQIASDKAPYATAIVQRWESDARASDRWDANYSTELFNALMGLQPENLLAAGQAGSYKAVLAIIANGPVAKSGATITPNYLGDILDDLVYTPITPCRIVDTRFATSYPFQLVGGTTYSFDVDGSNFSAQGGNPSGCGIPFGVPRAVDMTLTVTNTSGFGFLTAWQLFVSRPNSSFLNWAPGWTVANTAAIPVVPGGGADFNVFASSSTSVVIDVVGYFAAPVATPLDCTVVTNSAPLPVNVFTHVFAACPSGRTLSGGGLFYALSNTNAKSWPSGTPNNWEASFYPIGVGDTGTTYAVCCRMPGR